MERSREKYDKRWNIIVSISSTTLVTNQLPKTQTLTNDVRAPDFLSIETARSDPSIENSTELLFSEKAISPSELPLVTVPALAPVNVPIVSFL